MKNIFAFLFIAFSATSYGQFFLKETIKDNGNVKVENRTTEAYTKVSNIGNLYVVLTEGKVGSIRVEASDNILQYILTKVENGELSIRLDPKNNYTLKHKVVVYVPVDQSLQKILQKGSGDVELKDLLKVEQLSCELAGSGDLKINVKAKQLSLSVVGSGDLEAKGSVTELQAELTGSGDLDAEKLTAMNAKVTVNGSGDITTFVTENVEARVSGSGDIAIKGNPKKRDSKVMGSGDIRFMP
ncbi:DUF2807 domain-containing protein [Capnocytophaga canis]|uniref:DUF2807 domain-containing protein n=1 Tax=Capnocytophaga canis TaxID=1848903 RepID=A0A3A1YI99_9FLAO|nr:head GIN domain-containing protein [Capnocytophaga canis]RIY36989.1 DUF2807 domain-containing protein [Capnocytophaga canis]